MSIPYGYADGFDDHWCIVDQARPTHMLCGRRVGFVPATPPLFPANVHDRCRAKWFRTRADVQRAPRPEYGTCPECEGDVSLRGGLVEPHGQWVVGRHGPAVSKQPCGGAGRRPAEGSDD